MQVLIGPRQVGKTTLITQLMESSGLPHHYASADEPTLQDRDWLMKQWDLGRVRAKEGPEGGLLFLDEVQKIPAWSGTVKSLWDEDARLKVPLKVFLSGSAPLLVEKGLTESLAGRFEIIPITHWSFPEMREAFGFTLEEYVYFGGYPGGAELQRDETRWKRYIADSLIETTLSRDIFLLSRVDKPALLRRLFQLGCHYSGQVLSYQKMMGQLQDAGNTTTLAHYLELLSGAGMLTGLSKYAGQKVRQRGSSPKFQVLNTALTTCQLNQTFDSAIHDSELWGRLAESCVGTHLINGSKDKSMEVFYWREGHLEVDFILKYGKELVAFEVKSGRKKETLSGMEAFRKTHHPQRTFLIGPQGISLEEFLTSPLEKWF